MPRRLAEVVMGIVSKDRPDRRVGSTSRHVTLWLVFVMVLVLTLRGPVLLTRSWGNMGMLTLVHALTVTTNSTASQAAAHAEMLLQRVVDSVPGNHSAWRGLGFALVEQGREEEAMTAWETAGDSARVLIYHGWQAQSQGKPDEALQWYKRASQLDSRLADEWLYQIGTAYRSIGDLEQALQVFQRASELTPENRNVWYQLGLIHAWRGELQPALDAWQQGLLATKGSIGKSNLYYQIGKLQQRLLKPPDLTGAWEAYEQALMVDNFGYEKWQKADTYFQRGAILESQQKWQEAATEHKLVLELDHEHYWAHLGLASVLWEMGEGCQAESRLRRAIAIQPAKKNAYLQLGELYQAEGNRTEAQAMFLKVLEIDPDDKKAQKALADLQHRENTP